MRSSRAACTLAAVLVAAAAQHPARAGVERDMQAAYIRAASAVVSQRYPAARADALEMLRREPHDARATALLADVDFLGGRTAEARKLYAGCGACMPHPGPDVMTRDAVLRGRAAPFFRMLLPQLSEPYPDGPQPFDAVRAAAQGRNVDALRSLTSMVSVQPARPDLRFYRSLVLVAIGRRGEARRDLAVAVAFRQALPEPGVPAPLNRLQQISLWALAALSPS